MKAKSSAEVLEQSLAGFRGRLTAADAAARSGLPTRDAAEGLALLGAECAGHLAVTEKGELIYEFPRGFVRTQGPGLMRRIGRAIGRAAFGLVRFVVRAWLSVVLVGYAVVFAGVLIAIAAKSDDNGIGDVLGLLAQVVFEALYWTFHPFSPMYLASEPRWVRMRGRRKQAAAIPFYEKVNRFVFGPPPPAVEPRADLAKAVVEIRRRQGRAVPADIMRVTGGTREAAERTLLRLVADHEGEITVSEEGAILYEFPALRSTTGEGRSTEIAAAPPAWAKLAEVPPLTGNSVAFNVFFSTVNGFNLTMGSVALAQGLTIDRLIEMARRVGVEDPLPLPPPDGVPLALGLVPFLFSAALFAIPLLRRLGRRAKAARVQHDNTVRLLLRRLLAVGDDQRRFQFTPTELAEACTIAGRRPGDAEVERAVRALGGSVDIADDGTLRYTFDDLAREHAAVRAARALASPDEAAPGPVLLSSSD